MEKDYDIPPFRILKDNRVVFDYGEELATQANVRQAIDNLMQAASAQQENDPQHEKEFEEARTIADQLHDVYDDILHEETGEEFTLKLARANARLDDAVKALHTSSVFTRIFRTAKGSTYLQTKSGCTLRIKSAEVGRGFSRVQPVTRRGYFMSEEDFEREESAGTFKESSLAGHTFRISPLAIGTRSLDFDGMPGRSVVVREKDDGTIMVLGEVGHGEISNDSSSTYHIGNPVVEVIKDEA